MCLPLSTVTLYYKATEAVGLQKRQNLICKQKFSLMDETRQASLTCLACLKKTHHDLVLLAQPLFAFLHDMDGRSYTLPHYVQKAELCAFQAEN